jgi:hypothetical protein
VTRCGNKRDAIRKETIEVTALSEQLLVRKKEQGFALGDELLSRPGLINPHIQAKIQAQLLKGQGPYF